MIQDYVHEGREPSEKLAIADTLTDKQNGSLPFDKRLLTKQELSAVLGVSSRTIDNWSAAKRIPRLQLSARMTRFSLSKVEAALDRYEVKEVGAKR